MLSHLDLIAGSSFRGQYEKRLRGVIDEAAPIRRSCCSSTRSTTWSERAPRSGSRSTPPTC
jgi:hypothetical protein